MSYLSFEQPGPGPSVIIILFQNSFRVITAVASVFSISTGDRRKSLEINNIFFQIL